MYEKFFSSAHIYAVIKRSSWQDRLCGERAEPIARHDRAVYVRNAPRLRVGTSLRMIRFSPRNYRPTQKSSSLKVIEGRISHKIFFKSSSKSKPRVIVGFIFGVAAEAFSSEEMKKVCCRNFYWGTFLHWTKILVEKIAIIASTIRYPLQRAHSWAGRVTHVHRAAARSVTLSTRRGVAQWWAMLSAWAFYNCVNMSRR